MPVAVEIGDVTEEAYDTVAGRGEAAFEVQGSEFVGHVRSVHTVEDAESFVAAISEEYADATHNVPAYRVRADPLREYASDDGEPTGSAGKPALNVLTQREIENVVAVVTRYYGGTNLGVGGLARAYSRAVKQGVDDAGVVTERPHERLSITVDYDDSGTVRGRRVRSDLRGASRVRRARAGRRGRRSPGPDRQRDQRPGGRRVFVR